MNTWRRPHHIFKHRGDWFRLSRGGTLWLCWLGAWRPISQETGYAVLAQAGRNPVTGRVIREEALIDFLAAALTPSN